MNLQKLILASTWQGTTKTLSVCRTSLGSQSNMWVAVKNNYFHPYYSLVILGSLEKWYTLVSVWLRLERSSKDTGSGLGCDWAAGWARLFSTPLLVPVLSASPPQRCHPWWPGSGWRRRARPAQCPWCICWSHRWRNHIRAALGPCPCKTRDTKLSMVARSRVLPECTQAHFKKEKKKKAVSHIILHVGTGSAWR